MKTILTILGLTIYFCFPAFSQDINAEKLDKFFDSLENNHQTMGSFAVAKNGKIIYSRSIGFSSIDSTQKISATKETLYRIGSVTKTFTATMIFQLIEEGKISLHTTLDQYFPQIPNSKKITVDMLLRHRSGLYNYVIYQQDSEWIKRPQTKESIVAIIATNKSNFPPNKQVAYCNSGYFLLRCMIESITGLSYNENLQKRICTKLQLKNILSPPDNQRRDNEALSYSLTDNKWVLISDNYFPNITGVGDILSTPTDLLIFMDALLDGRLTSIKSLASMKDLRGSGVFGRGIMKINYDKISGFGHRGDTFGTHTAVARIIDDSLTFSSCINGHVMEPRDINIAVLKVCY
ncbi:MAG TPA: serine hydrolase domain-containing protein [Chryseolinea sp.]|nr:serine hydrolase domain-containing protein [Chryseolinea sp.]